MDSLGSLALSTEAPIDELFWIFWWEKTGFIDTNYFKKAITCIGEKFSEEDLQVIIDNIIKNIFKKIYDLFCFFII